MKKTFQKTLIAAAAGVALMSAVGTASANSLLFPYFTTATGAQSVLSLSNAGINGGAPQDQNLHYVYNYGSACTHYDAYGKLTKNDILSHSIASTTAGGFGLVVTGDKSTPVYFPLASQTGFLVVSSTSVASTDALRGSMAIVDPATGLVVSYPGIDNGLATTAGTNEGNFVANMDLNFPLSFMPSDLVTTSWYGVVVGDMNADIAAGRDWQAGAKFTNNGNVYDNDENAFSGTITKTITCAGPITAKDLMTGAQDASISAAKGGLIKATATAVAPAGPSTGTTTGVVMMKMQTVAAAVGAPFGGKQFLHREQEGK